MEKDSNYKNFKFHYNNSKKENDENNKKNLYNLAKEHELNKRIVQAKILFSEILKIDSNYLDSKTKYLELKKLINSRGITTAISIDRIFKIYLIDKFHNKLNRMHLNATQSKLLDFNKELSQKIYSFTSDSSLYKLNCYNLKEKCENLPILCLDENSFNYFNLNYLEKFNDLKIIDSKIKIKDYNVLIICRVIQNQGYDFAIDYWEHSVWKSTSYKRLVQKSYGSSVNATYEDVPYPVDTLENYSKIVGINNETQIKLSYFDKSNMNYYEEEYKSDFLINLGELKNYICNFLNNIYN